ncbi:ABC transporter ATP-binding protein [Saccharibacillus sp. CPCC 101409]|uniref:ATP-binding cassette domain-containing protein n=1 Tax=Saccharibacillus sp. CPCC 101409 TaxID=3058041 RepID=UPI0026733012|nr:ABC transporter ATP-binding protein [Saccharibacillus sp. CPCC 101409]MDO3412495.1 ABC transporter ATP-binding protein [Saccharibacillus sp. CPCC 101409]
MKNSFLKNLLLNNKKFVAITLVLVTLTSITATITPVLVQLLSNTAEGMSVSAFGIVIGAMTLSFVMQFALLVYRENYAARFNTQHLSSLLRRMHGMTYDSYIKREPTYLINRMFGAVDNLYLFLVSGLGELIRALLVLSVVLVLAFSVHVLVFLALLLLIPVNFFGFRFINRRLKSKMESMQEQSATANKDLVSTLSNADAVKQLPQYEVLERLLVPGIGKMYRTLAGTNRFAQGTSSIVDFINRLFQNMLYLTITYAIARQWLPIGSIVIVGLILPLFFDALGGLTRINLNLKTLETSLDFVASELDAQREADGAIEVGRIGEITLENPMFELDGKTMSYRINARLCAGQVVHLQGPSGSGKSSLLKLLLGFRNGRGIRINDIPIDKIAKRSLRSRIAYASQQMTILSKSLEENIGWGRALTNGEKEKLEKSAVLAPILRSRSWDAPLTENGANLSGGEKQRVAVARMLLQGADVYLLDECTSSIDQASADDIFRTLLEAAGGKLVIYTSHSRDAAKYATHTICIETGNFNEYILDDRGSGQAASGHDPDDPQLPEIR